MQARVTRITASVGSWIVGSGTFSMRTSPAAYITVPRTTDSPPSDRAPARIAHPLHARPRSRGCRSRPLDRDVGHEPRRRGAVPVVLARFEEDAVAGADHLDGAALALAEADALGHPDRLSVRVRVPGGARRRGEVDAGRAHPRLLRRRCDRVDVDGAREPVAGTGVRFEAVLCDLQRSLLPQIGIQRAGRTPGPLERVLPRNELPGRNLSHPAPVSAATMKAIVSSRNNNDQNELGAFLRARRSELGPSDVDLHEGGTQRRVAGLRREEVAQLAAISTDYYTRLEQGRIQPSAP